jgi:hypothetical protein
MAIGKAANNAAADILPTNHAHTFVLCMRNLPRDDLFFSRNGSWVKVYARLGEANTATLPRRLAEGFAAPNPARHMLGFRPRSSTQTGLTTS